MMLLILLMVTQKFSLEEHFTFRETITSDKISPNNQNYTNFSLLIQCNDIMYAVYALCEMNEMQICFIHDIIIFHELMCR